MSFAPDSPGLYVRPRPGLVKTLGIANVVFSVIGAFFLFTSVVWLVIGFFQISESPKVEAKVEVKAEVTKPAGPKASQPMVINPFMGMNDLKFLQFCAVDTITGIPLTVLMFTTGLGLINLKRWSAQWWFWLSWLAIIRYVIEGGYFIVEVTPSLSETMAKSVFEMLQAQGIHRLGMPPFQELKRVYLIMCLIMGVLIVVFGSIYPMLSIVLLSRPGLKAALVGKPRSMETELS